MMAKELTLTDGYVCVRVDFHAIALKDRRMK